MRKINQKAKSPCLLPKMAIGRTIRDDDMIFQTPFLSHPMRWFPVSSKPVLPGQCKHPSLIHFCSIPNASEVQLKSSQQPVLLGKCPGGNTLVSTGTTGNGFSEWTQLPFEPKSKLTRGDSILVSMQWQPHTLWVNGKKFSELTFGKCCQWFSTTSWLTGTS